MIKLIVLDVDGVILGHLNGVNFPFPTAKVNEYLTSMHNKGVRICLCTGKTSFTVANLIVRLKLNNLHITDGGAVIVRGLDNQIFSSAIIPSNLVLELLDKTPKALWELYTLKSKYVEAGVFPGEFQENGMPWIESDNLQTIAKTNGLVKLEMVCPSEKEGEYRNIFKPYEDQLSIQWTHVQALLPNKIVIITSKGVNKTSAVEKLIQHYAVSTAEVLAVGDTLMDWKFMEGCGYVATMGNAADEMKAIVKQHNGYIGGSINDDGIIDILEHFKAEITLTEK